MAQDGEIAPTIIPAPIVEPAPTIEPAPTLDVPPLFSPAESADPAPVRGVPPTFSPDPGLGFSPSIAPATKTIPVNIDITLGTQGPDPGTLAQGREFDWEIQVRWYGETGDVNPEIQAMPTFTGLQLVKPSTTLRTGAEGEKTYSEKIFRFRLRPQSEGQVTIGAAAIQYKLPGAEKENYLSTTPTTYTVQPAPFSWSEWLAGVWKSAWFRGLGSVLLLGCAVCVTLLIKRRYKKVEPVTVVEEINPVDEAFEEARRRRIEGDRSRFIRALKQAVQQAFAARFPDAASTDLSAYRDRLDMEARFIFDRFFETCEHIQFAPVSPSPDELDRVSDDARRLTEMIK